LRQDDKFIETEAGRKPFLVCDVDFWVRSELQRMLLFAHPLIAMECVGRVSLFVDGTFDVCPTRFKQCIVLMAYLQSKPFQSSVTICGDIDSVRQSTQGFKRGRDTAAVRNAEINGDGK
jgi:hypothetical protein